MLAKRKWVNIPYYKYDRRHIMSVRESHHTVMLWDRKYVNPETGKYNFEKLKTIATFGWSDIVETDYPDNPYNVKYPGTTNDAQWFFPKDNDFEDDEPVPVVRHESNKVVRYDRDHDMPLPTFVREDGSSMVCYVKRNCWIRK